MKAAELDVGHPIERAANLVGSKAALARALGVTKAAVGQWMDPGRTVPAQHCPAIERLTNRAVLCEELRPDIEWAVLRAPRPDMPTVAQECGI
jgi:DNA-binding transcriptional regulator YdaS (Cro superfamily)